ncbi:MAG: glycosyl hydrolase family 28-related protein [Gracilimonas sp.]|nr:glycosyl hydrolase family 28-related protein [Gracilimonas sp.]
MLSTIFLIIAGFVSIPDNNLTTTKSVYTQRPVDSEAYYFTPENYGIKADGVMDISDALQKAINEVKEEKNFGILFVPEGRYLISKTIYIPKAVRLIGYGKERPEFILGANTPGYQRGKNTEEKYMFWFTRNMVTSKNEPQDANPGTFYSAITNINFRIDEGNPNAVALRTHYAQHGFVSHSIINIGSGKAGISDVGNEMENVQFLGGEYGIISDETSSSWPMMMVDTYFEGQRKAAIQTNSAGLTIVNMHVKNVPIGLEMREGSTDRLFFENCLFENVSDAGIIINGKENSTNQINMLNIHARNVPIFARFRNPDEVIKGKGNTYTVREFVHGLVIDDLNTDSKFETITDIIPSDSVPTKLERTIPSLPSMERWVNIKDLGATG